MAARQLSAQDALWLTMDRPNNLMVIDVAVVFSGELHLETLRAAFTDLVARHPVFGQCARRHGVSWEWVDDPSFDMSHHVTAVRVPEGAGLAHVQHYVAEQRSAPLDRERPLWTSRLLQPVDLDDGRSGSVVVTRFHHAIADGVRLTQVMLGMLDSDFASSVPTVARSGTTSGTLPSIGSAAGEWARVALGATRAVAGAAEQVVTAPRSAATSAATAIAAGVTSLRHPDRLVDALEALGADDHRSVNDLTAVSKLAVGGSSRTVWTGTPGDRKAVAWSAPLPLDGIKAAARRHEVTLNDVLVTALAGALRTYLDGRGGLVDEVLWMVPVNLKAFDEALPADLGNHFALVMLDMPLDDVEPGARLQDLHHRMQRIRNSDEPAITFGLQQAISKAPSPIATWLTDFFANKAVGVLTNVPGPTRALQLGGVPVVQVIGFAPCSGDQPLTATIFTYAGTVTVGFASDAGLVPDPHTLVRLVEEELAALTTMR